MRKAVREKTLTSPSESLPYPSNGCYSGFSLVELLVALALVIGALAIAPTFFAKGISSTEFKSSVRRLAAGLRETRSEAVAHNQPRLFLLDVEERHFAIGQGAQGRPLPKALDLKLRTAESEQLSEFLGGIRFFPDGSSTGGEITVSNDTRSLRVTVDWITGRIAVVEAEAE